MRKILVLATLLVSFTVISQTDADVIKTIYDTSLSNGKSYEWLDHLSNKIGGRLSGSLNAERAVEWTKEELEKIGLDKVWLQPVMVPKWVRGEKEVANYEFNGEKINVPICALGGSIGTPSNGITAEIIEVKSLEEAKI